MNNFTSLEVQVYNAVLGVCYGEPEATVREISEATNLGIATVKGVIGSLVKKGEIVTDEEKRGGKVFQTINPLINGMILSFGCDEYNEADYEQLKK